MNNLKKKISNMLESHQKLVDNQTEFLRNQKEFVQNLCQVLIAVATSKTDTALPLEKHTSSEQNTSSTHHISSQPSISSSPLEPLPETKPREPTPQEKEEYQPIFKWKKQEIATLIHSILHQVEFQGIYKKIRTKKQEEILEMAKLLSSSGIFDEISKSPAKSNESITPKFKENKPPKKSLEKNTLSPKKSLDNKTLTPKKSLDNKTLTPKKSLDNKTLTPKKSLDNKTMTPKKSLRKKTPLKRKERANIFERTPKKRKVKKLLPSEKSGGETESILDLEDAEIGKITPIEHDLILSQFKKVPKEIFPPSSDSEFEY